MQRKSTRVAACHTSANRLHQGNTQHTRPNPALPKKVKTWDPATCCQQSRGAQTEQCFSFQVRNGVPDAGAECVVCGQVLVGQSLREAWTLRRTSVWLVVHPEACLWKIKKRKLHRTGCEGSRCSHLRPKVRGLHNRPHTLLIPSNNIHFKCNCLMQERHGKSEHHTWLDIGDVSCERSH